MGRLINDRLFNPPASIEMLIPPAPPGASSSGRSFDRHLQDAQQQARAAERPSTANRSNQPEGSQPLRGDTANAESTEATRQSSENAQPASQSEETPVDAPPGDGDEQPIAKEGSPEEAPVEALVQQASESAALAAAAAGQPQLLLPTEAATDAPAEDVIEAEAPVDEAGSKTSKKSQANPNASPADQASGQVKATAKPAVDAVSFPGTATEGPAEEHTAKSKSSDSSHDVSSELSDVGKPPSGQPTNRNPNGEVDSNLAAASITALTPKESATVTESLGPIETVIRNPRSQARGRAAPQPSDPTDPTSSGSASANLPATEVATVAILESPLGAAAVERGDDAVRDLPQPVGEALTGAGAEASGNVPKEATPLKGIAASMIGSATHRGVHGAEISEADRARFVQRVARAFQSAGEDGGQLRLRLSPPELGSMRLEITVNKGVLAAHVEAETPQARQLLLDNLPALRERLQEQNIKIERFDIDVANQSSNGWSQESARQRQQENHNRQANLRQTTAPEPEAISMLGIRQRPVAGDGKLNVVI